MLAAKFAAAATVLSRTYLKNSIKREHIFRGKGKMTTDSEPNTITAPSACDVLHVREKEREVFEVFSQALQFYTPGEIMLSFNGGKDCTVLLHLLSRYFQSHCLKHIRIPVLYIQSEGTFEEIEQFVMQCSVLYNIELITRQGCIKNVLEDICREMPHIKAFIMGNRRTDPHCSNLQVMQATDPGWPPLMRINPILDWRCRDVWSYIFTHQVFYCSLYDRGYTSLGNKNNTRPNPHLKMVDPKTCKIYYRPAYELPDEDDSLERAGRC